MSKAAKGALALLLGLGVQPGLAQTNGAEGERPDTFVLNVGGFFINSIDASASARRANGVLGTSIDLERDLDAEERVGVPWLQGYYRFTPHQRIDFSYYRLERDGKRTLVNRPIRFGNQTFKVNRSVKTTFKNEVWKLAYTWSFYHVPRVELGLTAGVHVTRYEMKLRTTGGAVSQREEVTAPLPVLGLRMDYAINRDWHILFSNESMYVDLGGDLQGSLNDYRLAVEWRPFQHVHFGLGTNRLSLNANVENKDWVGQLDNSYRGFLGYVGMRF